MNVRLHHLSERAGSLRRAWVRIVLALAGTAFVVAAFGADHAGVDSSPQFGIKQVALSVTGTAMLLLAALHSSTLRRPPALVAAGAAWVAAMLADPLGFGGAPGFGPGQILVAEAAVIVLLAALLRPAGRTATRASAARADSRPASPPRVGP